MRIIKKITILMYRIIIKIYFHMKRNLPNNNTIMRIHYHLEEIVVIKNKISLDN